MSTPSTDNPLKDFGKQRDEVLKLLQNGMSVDQIAEQTGISEALIQEWGTSVTLQPVSYTPTPLGEMPITLATTHEGRMQQAEELLVEATRRLSLYATQRNLNLETAKGVELQSKAIKNMAETIQILKVPTDNVSIALDGFISDD